MKIAVDCRYLGKSGIGRVCEGIIDNLDYSKHTFYLIGNKEKLKNYYNAIIIENNTNPYSKKGLFNFNKKFVNKECDCLIIPNFLIPFGIKIPVHSVMHDLIFLDVKETVNGKLDYIIKKMLLKRCMKKSKSIACDSLFTKSRCEVHFNRYINKCYLNYPGLSGNIINYKNAHDFLEKTNTVIFVGNVKKHKGLLTLLEAFSELNDSSLELKIIGEREGFLTGLNVDEKQYPNVTFTGKINDETLYSEIQRAKYLVQPSVYEGFGLPPIEALFLDTQPIISDIPVFNEIYSDMPVKFFKDSDHLKRLLEEKNDDINCSQMILENFNYKIFAETLMTHVQG